MDATADYALRRRDALEALRSPHLSIWQDLADYVRPMRTGFASSRRPGDRPGSKLYDGTAPMGADRLAAGLYGLITNPANQWFSLRHSEEGMNDIQEVKEWLDGAGEAMRQALLDGGLGFYSRVPALFADVVVFGTGCFYVDEDLARGRLWFSNRYLAEIAVAENDREEIDTIVRTFRWSARKAHQRWGDDAGPQVVKALEKEPDREFVFVHLVEPNPDADPTREGVRFKAFRSLYVAEDGRHLASRGGYDENPFMTPRWSRTETTPYGDGAAILALPDAKMVNAMGKTMLIAAQKLADPPLLAADELSVGRLRTTPGGITYGGIDGGGNQLVRPLVSGAQVGLSLDLEEQRRAAIREAFHAGLLLMVGQPNRTATEVLESQEEKLRLMAPHLGRIQAEFLDPLLGRVFGLLMRAGRLPPPPNVLLDTPGVRVEYVSPLARAAKAAEGAAVMRMLDAVLPLANIDPSVMDNIDLDAVARTLADSFGTPPKLMRDLKAIEAMRRQRADAQQQAQQLAMATQAAGAAKDLAGAAR